MSSHSANKSPAYQFYPAEYLADENVAVMTLEEEGAYNRAMAYCWREGSIPADNERLARLLKGASNQVLTVVRECFKQSATDPTRLIHLRLEKEREKQAQWRAKSSEGGRASGISRRANGLADEPNAKGGSDLVEPNANSLSLSSKEQILTLSGSVNSAPQSVEKKTNTETTKDADRKIQAEALYEAYPKKKGRAGALRAIARALRVKSFDELYAAVLAFSRQVAKEGKDINFVPHPETWFNKGFYDDEDLRNIAPRREFIAAEPTPENWLLAQIPDEASL